MRVGSRRAYVLELTGTPKSGKTTTLSMLQGFFKASEFKVSILRERAADCPLPMKGHFFFNAWTTCTMLAEVLATFETNVDILILDRGFFDALIWLELQKARCQVSQTEEEVFSKFVLLDRWRSLVDLTLVMTVQPKVALEREDKSQLVQRRGSMMNEHSLAEFNRAVREARRKYRGSFPMMKLDTTKSTDPHASAVRILEQTLPLIERWADRTILVLPRSEVERLFGRKHFLHQDESRVALKSVVGFARGMSRFEAEGRQDVVQLVACGDSGQRRAHSCA
jgi:thymidylate kinase